MNRTYECMVLLDNREVRQGWDVTKAGVAGLLTKHGAEIVSAKLWEERRLAYPIKHQQRGTYLLVYFKSETERLGAINRELTLSEPIMRHLTTAIEGLPEDIDAPEKEFDAAAVSIEDLTGPAPQKREAEEEQAPSASARESEAAGEAGADAENEGEGEVATTVAADSDAGHDTSSNEREES